MIDAHIHLDDERFDDNRAELIAQAQSLGIEQFIVPAVKTSGFKKLEKFASEYTAIKPSYGLHPYFINEHNKDDLKYLDMWLSSKPSCAVGECGLDFFLKNLDKDTQLYYFQAQIELAKKYKLPLIIHARGAVDAVFHALKNADYFHAMIHSYNGSIQQTKQLLDRGIKFSFGGAICHPRAHKLHKLITYCPTDSIMFETDAPDQNLYPNNKTLNHPINLVKIIEYYAHITQTDLDTVKSISTKITNEFFD